VALGAVRRLRLRGGSFRLGLGDNGGGRRRFRRNRRFHNERRSNNDRLRSWRSYDGRFGRNRRFNLRRGCGGRNSFRCDGRLDGNDRLCNWRLSLADSGRGGRLDYYGDRGRRNSDCRARRG
jgi:hypothetical protein